jgi:hypothetical protein
VQVWDVLVIQGELRSKNGIKQNVFRIAFKEASLLCKNTEFAILYLTSFRPVHLMGPSTSGRPLIEKLKRTKRF